MTTQLNQWWTRRKTLVFFVSMAAIAIALTACGKNKKEDKPTVKGAAAVPASVTSLNFNSLIDMAAANSPEVAKLVQQTPNRALLQVSAVAEMSIPSLLKNGQPTQNANLVLSIKVSSGSQSASATVTSNESQISLIANPYSSYYPNLGIEGYWVIRGTQSQYPAYVGINAVVKEDTTKSGADRFYVAGQLVSNFDNNGTIETLATFQTIPVCDLVKDGSFIDTDDGYLQCPTE